MCSSDLINIKQYLTDTQPIYYNSLRLSFFLRERESRHCGVKQSVSHRLSFFKTNILLILVTPISHIGTHQNTFSISLENIEAIWYLLLNNSFQCLNNNNVFDTYFYNIQIRISIILKIEQQYLNTATK